MLKKLICLMILALFVQVGLKAQSKSVFGPAGTTQSSIQFNIGEAVSSKMVGADITLYQGFIRPYPIVPAPLPQQEEVGKNGLVESEFISLAPNPLYSGDLLLLRSESFVPNSTKLQLWSSNGLLIDLEPNGIRQRSEGNIIEVSLELSPGFYMMKIPMQKGYVIKRLLVR